jgi:hypothetical protein
MKIKIKNIIIGQEISYIDIETILVSNDNITYYQYGDENLIGENFIVLKDGEKDLTVSFMLTGYNGNGNCYNCIYSDYQ